MVAMETWNSSENNDISWQILDEVANMKFGSFNINIEKAISEVAEALSPCEVKVVINYIISVSPPVSLAQKLRPPASA